MSTLRRLLGTAQKALDAKGSSSARPGQGSDWRSLVRGAADALTGDSGHSGQDRRAGRDDRYDHGERGHAEPQPDGSPTPSYQDTRRSSAAASGADLSAEDRRAIARYDYLVHTAEPEQLERVHREAFERLTPQQRTLLTSTLRSELPEGERPRSDAPQDLARSATRLGALDPRRLTRLLGRSGGTRGTSGRRGPGGGALAAGALGAGAVGAGVLGAGGLLAAVAGGAVVSSVGGALLQDALGAGIDIDALSPELLGDLGGFAEGLEGVEGVPGVEGFERMADGFGGSVTDAGDQLSGLGEQISGLGLDDLFGR